jgi:hypothetical protein
MKKRNLLAELNEGLDALADQRAGKQTLRTHEVEIQPALLVTAEEGAGIACKTESVARRICPLTD